MNARRNGQIGRQSDPALTVKIRSQDREVRGAPAFRRGAHARVDRDRQKSKTFLPFSCSPPISQALEPFSGDVYL